MEGEEEEGGRGGETGGGGGGGVTELSGLIMARWFLLGCILPESDWEGGKKERQNELVLLAVQFPEIQLGWFLNNKVT